MGAELGKEIAISTGGSKEARLIPAQLSILAKSRWKAGGKTVEHIAAARFEQAR
jgi:hypothetical protein